MSLDHILLSILQEPASGYDLKREFEAGASTFWPAHLSQIYPTLRRLEAQGLLESSTAPSDRGPERRIYTRTEKGAAELERWVRSGPQIGRERFAYIGQLAALGEISDPRYARVFVTRLRGWLERRLEHLEPFEDVILEGEPPEAVDDARFFDWAVLLMGTRALRARIRSCDEILALMERRASSSTSDPLEG